MALRPCLTCGELAEGSRCERCRVAHARGKDDRSPARARAHRDYDWAWRRLSERARRLQPWCSRCGTREDLTTDHTPEAWRRREAGLPIRLVDVDVLCRAHNSSAGTARGPRARRH